MKKITVALLRDLEGKVLQGEISYSRMVEILNQHVKEDTGYPTDTDIEKAAKEYADVKGNIGLAGKLGYIHGAKAMRDGQIKPTIEGDDYGDCCFCGRSHSGKCKVM